MMYELYGNHMGWGAGSVMGWFGGGIMMLVFWVLLIVFIVWMVREISGKNSPSHSGSNALEILKERYAKGEIDKEEFESKKKDISG